MKLLVATPAFGGFVSTGYTKSAIQTKELLLKNNINVHFYFIDNESLIQRARNQCATFALKNKYDRLLFIDADISWEPDDLVHLLNSNKAVVGGTYPTKCIPPYVNFNPLLEDIDKYFSAGFDRSFETFKKYRENCADENGEVKVMHVPTGFLQINVKVLEKLSTLVETYRNGRDGEMRYDFFPCRVRNGVLESEDWGFCSLCRDNGIPVYLQTKIILSHTGTYEFKAE